VILLHPFIVLMVLVLGGCFTTQPVGDVTASGFLEDYSQLKPGERGQAALIYLNPNANLGRYDKFMIDDVAIWYSEEESLRDLPEDDLKQLSLLLKVRVIEALKNEGLSRVKEPGPGAMRIRAAITDAKKSKPILDTVTTVLPQSRVVSAAKRLAFGTHSFVGRAGIEGELLDSQTGERLGAMVDRRGGGKTLQGSLHSWDDVEQAFKFWADRLAYRLCLAKRKLYCVPPE
jgi:Protein of unknown function (DUF3313)